MLTGWDSDAGGPRLGAGRLLSREEEQDLARRVEAGDSLARQRFIEANLRLVVAIARRYQTRSVALGDLVQEGTIGLIQAVDHFDWRKGTRFSTCATLWIKQAILRALPGLRHSIKVPPHVLREAGRVESAIERLTQELQRPPSRTEVEAHVASDLQSLELHKLPLDTVSLDAGFDLDDGRQLADGLADWTSPDPEERTVESLSGRHLQKAFECLGDREREVLTLRFGLGAVREHTLGEIGARLGLSRQRVKQIETAALLKLRRQVQRERWADER